MIFSENKFPLIRFATGAAPEAPPAGQIIVYTKGDGKLYRKGADGVEHAIGEGGAGLPPVWGDVLGSLSDQTDLVEALEGKSDSGHNHDGVYVKPSDLPVFGSAATAEATDFATAAQGAKADSAVQPGALGTLAAANDVPTDGKDYVRKDGAWVEVVAPGSSGPATTHTTAPTDGVDTDNPYLYYNQTTGEAKMYLRTGGGVYIEMGSTQVDPGTPPEDIDPNAMLLGLNGTWPNYWSQGPVFANLMYSAAYPTAPNDGATGVMSNYDRGAWTSSDPDAIYSIALTARAYLHPIGDYTILNPDGLQVQLTQNSTSPNPANWSNATAITWNFAGGVATSGDEFIRLFVKGSMTRINGNLAVILPDHLDSWASGNVWAKSYIDFHKALKTKTLRAMDLTSASNNYETNWSERSLPDRINYHNEWSVGGEQGFPPYEVLCDLANRIGCNIWICVPHRATDDYFTNLAGVLNTHKPTGYKIYIEVGNEVWNTGGAYANGTAWFNLYDYTKRKFSYDPATKLCTLVGHGFTDGQSIRCFGDLTSAKQNAGYEGEGGIYLLDRGTLNVKKITDDTFRCFTEAALINEIPAPWNTTSPFDVIFVDPNEAGKTPRLGGAYGQRSKEMWDILDPVVGRTNLVHVIASQGVSTSSATSRITDPAVKAATDYVAIAPYFNGMWVAGKLVATSGAIAVSWWSNADHDVYIHAVAKDTVVSQQDVITSGTKYAFATNGSDWRAAKTFSGLTDDSQYDIHFVFSAYGITTHFVKTITVSAAGTTVFVFDDVAKKAQRDIADSFNTKAMWVANNVTAVAPVPVICYEGGLEDYSVAPTDFRTAVGGLIGKSNGDWISEVYQETPDFANAMVAHLHHAALYGAKEYSYYSSARLGCFSIASHFGDVTDERYLAFKNLGGYINPVTSIFSSKVIPATDIEEEPVSFPATVITFPAGATYSIVGGNAKGRFAISGNALQYVDGTGVDYENDPQLQNITVMAVKGKQIETARVTFQLGYSWYAPDAKVAWDAFNDTTPANGLEPTAGALAGANNTNLNLITNSVPGWWYFPRTAGFYYDNHAVGSAMRIDQSANDVLLAATIDQTNPNLQYADVIRLHNSAILLSLGAGSGKPAGSMNAKPGNITASIQAQPCVYWVVMRKGVAVSSGCNQTVDASDAAFSSETYGTPNTDNRLDLFIGSNNDNSSRNQFSIGAFQVVVRPSITDAEAKAMVAKMQVLHGVA